jgi:phosphohistidine phosphatase
MRLFFLRHGLAQPRGEAPDDAGRVLTPHGRAELAIIARALGILKVKPDPILSSPYRRARQTAEIVAPTIGGKVTIAEELSAGAPPDVFEKLIRRFASHDAVMFVGHEPDLSNAAANVAGADEGSIVLKKAGLIRIDVDDHGPHFHGQLRWLLTPRQLMLIGGGE